MNLLPAYLGPSVKYEVPALEFKDDKFSIFRQYNVETVAENFQKNPNNVEVFSDAKFGSEPLVLFRKTKLEGMMKLFRDFTSGQALIKHNIETLADAITILSSRIAEKNIIDPQLQASLNILMKVSAQINTEILIAGDKKGLELSEVTAEELKDLPED